MPSRHGFLVPIPLKQLFSPHPLGIAPVENLQPRCAWEVGIEFVLRNYAFEVSLADKMEQLFTHALNMIAVQQPFTVAWDQATQAVLPIRERQIAQVLAVAEKQIKGVVARLTSAKEQVSELRIAGLVQANDLSIQNSILGVALLRKSKIESRERLKLIPVAGDQPAMAILEVCQSAKTIPLELIDPVRMGKWPGRTADWHRLKIQQHLSNMIRDSGGSFLQPAARISPGCLRDSGNRETSPPLSGH